MSIESRGWKEADVTINGVKLTFAQSMTLRVALNSFAMSLSDKGLGDDDTGKSITAGYLRCIKEMNDLIRDDIGGSVKNE